MDDEDFNDKEFQCLNQHLSGLGISQDFMLEMRDVFQQFDKVYEMFTITRYMINTLCEIFIFFALFGFS